MTITVEQDIARAANSLDPDSFQPLIRKAAEDFYCKVLEDCQDYLKDNAEFNIGSTIDTLRRENASLREATRQAEEQIKLLVDAMLEAAQDIGDGAYFSARQGLIEAAKRVEATNG